MIVYTYTHVSIHAWSLYGCLGRHGVTKIVPASRFVLWLAVEGSQGFVPAFILR